DAAGRFAMEGVRAGEHVWVSIRDKDDNDPTDNRTLLSRQITVKEGETAEVKLAIETGHLRGCVVMAADGKPVRGVLVIANRLAADGKEQDGAEASGCTAITDDQGRFRMENVQTGGYGFGIHHEGYAKKASRSVQVRRGQDSEEVRIEIITALTVAGTVEF